MMTGSHRLVLSCSGRRWASGSRTHLVWRAVHASEAGRRPIVRVRLVPSIAAVSLGRSPDNPWRAARGAWALAPSRAWFPGRRGPTDLGSRRPLLFDPANCNPHDGASVNTQPLHSTNRPAAIQPAGRKR
jgi:hypothetical protein